MNLSIDNLRIIFNFLSIPNKRNFIKVNKYFNVLSNLMTGAELEFWNYIMRDYIACNYTIGLKTYSCVKKSTLYTHVIFSSYCVW